MRFYRFTLLVLEVKRHLELELVSIHTPVGRDQDLFYQSICVLE